MAPTNALYHIMMKAAERPLPPLLRDFGELGQLYGSVKHEAFLKHSLERCQEIVYESLQLSRPHFTTALDTKRAKDTPCWHLLPLTGFENFAHSLPHFALAIFLEEGPKFTAALLYDPIKNEVFSAQHAQGTYMNRQRLRASNRQSLPKSLIAFTHRILENEKTQMTSPYETLHRHKIYPRETGAPLLDLAYLAAGRIDAVLIENPTAVEKSLSQLLSRETGSTPLMRLSKKNNVYLAANPDLRAKIEIALQP